MNFGILKIHAFYDLKCNHLRKVKQSIDKTKWDCPHLVGKEPSGLRARAPPEVRYFQRAVQFLHIFTSKIACCKQPCFDSFPSPPPTLWATTVYILAHREILEVSRVNLPRRILHIKISKKIEDIKHWIIKNMIYYKSKSR